MKRADYITWDQYFMGIAIMSALRSKDPGTQVGACIVDNDNRILSVGYNGMPTGCNDDDMPWNRDGEGLTSKYFFVCHAKAIIQSGIREVIYMSDKYADTDSTIASKKMFDMAGVKYTPYKQNHKQISFEL